MSVSGSPKRFYKAVSAEPLADGGFRILLDGRELKTPAKNPLIISTEALANAVRDEWDAQTNTIETDSMPIMRLHAIAIDRAKLDYSLMIEDALRYAETDLVCYVSDDASINARQHELFAPIHDWWNAQYNIPLATTMGLMPIAQDERLEGAIKQTLAAMHPLELAATAMVTPLLGSIIIALALYHGALNAEGACLAARIEEDIAAERYGIDPLVVAAWQPKARDIHAAAFVFDALRS